MLLPQPPFPLPPPRLLPLRPMDLPPFLWQPKPALRRAGLNAHHPMPPLPPKLPALPAPPPWVQSASPMEVAPPPIPPPSLIPPPLRTILPIPPLLPPRHHHRRLAVRRMAVALLMAAALLMARVDQPSARTGGLPAALRARPAKESVLATFALVGVAAVAA